MNQNAKKLYELKKKDPTTAVILSILLTGLGQVYSGSILKGVIIFVITMVLWSFWMGWIMWFIAPVDAYYTAVDQNKILALEMKINKE